MAADSIPSGHRVLHAGRGVATLGLARAYHLFTGYAVAVVLPRLLGSPEVFGLYSKVTAAIAILNSVLIAASVQSVSKLVAAARNGEATYRKLLGVHLALGTLASAAVFASASAVAAFHRDAALIPLLRTISIVPLGYAVYAAAVGYLNGCRRFARQAQIDVAFYTLRVAGVLGAAATIGGGALAPVLGLAAASIVIGAVSLAAVGLGARASGVSIAGWAAFAAPLWIYHLVLNALLELDVQVLARAVSDLALEGGRAPAAAADLANAQVGFYHAAQRFAFAPYHLMLALSAVVFPIIARATSEGELEEARSTIRSAFRMALLALFAVAAPVAGASAGVMRLVYPDEYLAGAPALRILSFGLVAFGLFVLAGTVLASASHPRLTALIASVGLITAVVGNYVLVRRAGIGDHTLFAAALGTSSGMLVAMVLAGAAVYVRFRALVLPLTFVRALLAAGVAYVVAAAIPHGTWAGALVAPAMGFGSYLCMLILTRELGGSDWSAMRQALTRP